MPHFSSPCRGFKKKDGKIEKVPIVNGFQDVFHEDLPGKHVDREVEFSIDLVPRDEPVARTPYRHGLVMTELELVSIPAYSVDR